MSAREEVLARLRRARGDTEVVPVPRDYRSRGKREAGSIEVLDLLADRLIDYRAEVTRCDPDGIPAAVQAALGEVESVVIPPGLPTAWAPGGIIDDRFDASALDRFGAVVTAATAAAAETGTIVLDGSPDQGRRAISLVPDLHVCVVRAEQVVESVPELISALDAVRPLTFISGPSATSDIELERVEGVHGPRRLHVILTS